MDDVAIDVRSGEFEQSAIVAIVTGRTHSDVARGLATREATEQMVRVHPREIASDGRFALLYIHGEGEWRLTLAQFRAELSATPDTLPGPLGMGWQDLWTRELCTKQQDFCIVADIWRHL
jgi:hypothetical protein